MQIYLSCVLNPIGWSLYAWVYSFMTYEVRLTYHWQFDILTLCNSNGLFILFYCLSIYFFFFFFFYEVNLKHLFTQKLVIMSIIWSNWFREENCKKKKKKKSVYSNWLPKPIANSNRVSAAEKEKVFSPWVFICPVFNFFFYWESRVTDFSFIHGKIFQAWPFKFSVLRNQTVLHVIKIINLNREREEKKIVCVCFICEHAKNNRRWK